MTARMMAVAVAPNRQRQGIGRLMNKEFEEEAKRRGYKRIYLHARVVAVSFYENLGYEVYGDEFIQVTIPHRHMQKTFKQPDELTAEELVHGVKPAFSVDNVGKWLSTEFQDDLDEA